MELSLEVQTGASHGGERTRNAARAVLAAVMGALVCTSPLSACDDCGCLQSDLADDVDETCPPPHSHAGSASHFHNHFDGTIDGSAVNLLSSTPQTAAPTRANGSAPPTVKFAVIGDTQGGEFGGHSNLLTRLMESVNTHNVDYVLFPGDLLGDSGANGWNAWKSRTSIVGTNSLGRDKRLMTPGNHDRGSGGTFANWQNTFDWLPDSQLLSGQQGIDQVDYFVDHGNVRFVSISTDAPGQIYNSRHVNQAPPALDWMRAVMQDVDARNADADPDNNIDHVFTFSHRAVTTQFESPTGGTNGAWWESMTGQDAQSGDHAATAFLAGHWHMYQPSRPDPDVDTIELISGTGGGGLEGQPHRNRHGYSIVTVSGGDVESEFYGDFNQGSDDWDFQLLDEVTIAQAGGLPRGELALYDFGLRSQTADSSMSPLSKGHLLNFINGPSVVIDGSRGSVLDVSGSGDYVDAKNIGDNNLAELRDLTISLAAKADSLDPGERENTLVAFGTAHGAFNGSLNGQESANHAYHLSLTSAGNLQFAWQFDDAFWETLTSTEPVDDPTAWHDYEFRRDADNMGVAFFVDGEQLGQALAFDALPTGGGSGSLFIGAGAGGEFDFNGRLDSLRISNADVTVDAPVEIVPGDFDFNQVVNGADWLLFAAELGSTSPGATDLNFDGVNDSADFLLFKGLFEDFNGSGSFQRLIAGVPEPNALIIGSLSFAMASCRPHRSQRKRFRGLR